MSVLLDVACRWATGAPVNLPTAASSRLAVSQALHLAATFAARAHNLHTAQAVLAAEKVFHLSRKMRRALSIPLRRHLWTIHRRQCDARRASVYAPQRSVSVGCFAAA